MGLLSTFLWTSWPGEGFPSIIWPIVGFIWVGSAILSFYQRKQLTEPELSGAEAKDTLLIRAQTEYLKGNWSDVQSLISRRLEDEPRDIPARLLLATMFRRTGNLNGADHQLSVLSRFDESVEWHYEIALERKNIQQADSDREPISSDPEVNQTNNSDGKTVVLTDSNTLEYDQIDDFDDEMPKAA